MLRLFASVSLGLLVVSIAIILLITRPWGWSEYASPELYVVYYQNVNRQTQYFVINADGADAGAKLSWNGGDISQVDCSPDGRTFAFLTTSGHLYVMTSAGLEYDSAEDRMYTTVNVADDGTTALFDPAAGRLLVNARPVVLSTQTEAMQPLDRVDISAQGQVLWTRDFQNIQGVSLATGAATPYVSHGYSGEWLAPGRMFAFADQVTDPEGVGLGGGQYIMDTTTQMVARIGYWTLHSSLSPDSTKVAVAVPISSLNHVSQAVVYRLFTNDLGLVLTHDPHTPSLPVCFLTFRPETLIAGG